jgi:hypothetical protein
MTYAELPVMAWFILPRDPNEGLLFKCDARSAMDRQYRHLLIAGDEDVILARLPSQPGAEL